MFSDTLTSNFRIKPANIFHVAFVSISGFMHIRQIVPLTDMLDKTMNTNLNLDYKSYINCALVLRSNKKTHSIRPTSLLCLPKVYFIYARIIANFMQTIIKSQPVQKLIRTRATA